jgi:hypothetical protein
MSAGSATPICVFWGTNERTHYEMTYYGYGPPPRRFSVGLWWFLVATFVMAVIVTVIVVVFASGSPPSHPALL